MRGRARSVSEKDNIYCPFFRRTGSCIHGDSCSRMHIRPQISRTITLSNLYPNPQRFISMLPANSLRIESQTLDQNFDDFYFDVYEELRMYGPIEDMMVAGNLGDNLVGNVMVKFEKTEDAFYALNDLRGRFYAGRPIDAQFSPVSELINATCRQFWDNQCSHELYCNYIHPKNPSSDILSLCRLSKSTLNKKNEIPDRRDNWKDNRDAPRGYSRGGYRDDERRARYDDRPYDSRRYDGRRADDRYDSRRYDDRRPEDNRRYDNRRYDDRRTEERSEDRFYDRRPDDRYDSRRYDNRRYDDRRDRYSDRRDDRPYGRSQTKNRVDFSEPRDDRYKM